MRKCIRSVLREDEIRIPFWPRSVRLKGMGLSVTGRVATRTLNRENACIRKAQGAKLAMLSRTLRIGLACFLAALSAAQARAETRRFLAEDWIASFEPGHATLWGLPW